MTQSGNSYWVKNVTGNDLVFSELGIKIAAMSEIDLFRQNPVLTAMKVMESAKSGSLNKCFKLKKIIKIPKPSAVTYASTHTYQIKESLTPIPSRVKTSIVVNPQDHDHIEELSGDFKEEDESKFVNYADGFADPIQYEDTSIAVESISDEIIEAVPSNDKYQPINRLLSKK